MRLLRATDRLATPWKNGGGVTREVMAWPPGADFDDFHWRVSLAEVTADGPFSVFPGVDRILTVLTGGLRLTVDGRPPVILTQQTGPTAFPGDVSTWGALAGGPVLDLNVLSRRGLIRASLRRLDVLRRQMINADGEAQLMVAGPNGLRVTRGEVACDLDPYDGVLLCLDSTQGLLVEAAKPSVAYLASFEPV